VRADASVLLTNGIHAVVIEQVFNRWCWNALMYGGEFVVSGTKNEKKNKIKYKEADTADSTPHNPDSK
jgi:hypothetical protein